MNFIEFAKRIIREENRPLTPNEIWEIGKSKGFDKFLNSSGKTPWKTISSSLYIDVRDNPSTKFIKLKLKPIKFFLKDLLSENNITKYTTDEIVVEEISIEKEQKTKYKERDLHKYLTYFVYNYGFIYTKTIFHEESNKTKYAQWLHPDIVGVYFPIEEWEPEILDISKEINSFGIKLFSYEIKRKLNLVIIYLNPPIGWRLK